MAYKKGDKVISNCLFCGMEFDEAQPIGEQIHCPTDEAGCGESYVLKMVKESAIKSKGGESDE